jgi:NAD(P)-dependent dehydrogenase (short-subunit alcohol dehydrogenase family)
MPIDIRDARVLVVGAFGGIGGAVAERASPERALRYQDSLGPVG